MGGLWSRALLPLHYFNQNTSVLNPSASTNNYAPRQNFVSWKILPAFILSFIVRAAARPLRRRRHNSKCVRLWLKISTHVEYIFL